MIIKGLQKLTLLDYPGSLAAIVFVGGCNFRCPFCHNGTLVLGGADTIDTEQIFSFLESRRTKLGAVVISGGEPTIYSDLPDFIRRVRELGYKVKLDTNGTNPDMLISLVESGLVDYVAMDIKNSPDAYESTAGARVDIDAVKRSVDFLLSNRVEYEFRTTVVKGMHTPQDIVEIGKWIQGADKYFIQPYRDSDLVIDRSCERHSDEELQAILAAAREYVPAAELRG